MLLELPASDRYGANWRSGSNGRFGPVGDIGTLRLLKICRMSAIWKVGGPVSTQTSHRKFSEAAIPEGVSDFFTLV